MANELIVELTDAAGSRRGSRQDARLPAASWTSV